MDTHYEGRHRWTGTRPPAPPRHDDPDYIGLHEATYASREVRAERWAEQREQLRECAS